MSLKWSLFLPRLPGVDIAVRCANWSLCISCLVLATGGFRHAIAPIRALDGLVRLGVLRRGSRETVTLHDGALGSQHGHELKLPLLV